MRAGLIAPSDAEWLRLLEAVRADVYYLPGYVNACARRECGEGFLFAAMEGENIWLQPLIIRKIPGTRAHSRQLVDAVSPYGYSGPLARIANDRETAWTERARARFIRCLAERGVVSAFIRMHPILNKDPASISPDQSLTLRGRTVVVDLARSAEQHWCETRANHRRNINSSLRSGFTASVDNDPNILRVFHDIYLHTMERVGASRYHIELANDFEDVVPKYASNLYFCTVRRSEEIACIGIFTEMNGIVQYHLSGTRDEFLSYRPSKLMLHYVRSWARERGNDFLHLGGGVGSAVDPLLHFKLGFSSQTLPYYTWDLVVNQTSYSYLVGEQHGCLSSPGKELHFFPAYRGVPTEMAELVSRALV